MKIGLLLFGDIRGLFIITISRSYDAAVAIDIGLKLPMSVAHFLFVLIGFSTTFINYFGS